jgi:hypothetical protein
MSNREEDAAVVATMAAVMLVTLAVIGIRGGVHVHRDIGAWVGRAQIASDAGDMAAYLGNVIDGMQKWELTTGPCSLINPNAGNDLGLVYRSLLHMQERAVILSDLDPASSAYNDGLDDLRGTLREWGAPCFWCVAVTQSAWLFALWWFDFALWIVASVLWLRSW